MRCHWRAKGGFALISTLSLMVLIVTLLVALLSMSSVSLKDSAQHEPVLEARANARLALKMAIGELQKEMGPDQRISITADQRMLAGGDGSESSSTLEKRHWTGVFDSWSSLNPTRPTPVFR